MKPNLLLVLLLFIQFSWAQETEIQYLSGTGADRTVDWQFYCSAGMNSGRWTTILVPSCWEQQGFGSYNYGHDKLETRLNETGTYRYRFTVPDNWKNKQVQIVFDGVMTDALVKINGKLAGPVHQGAFYQFKYDITKLLRWGRENQLEVFVKKNSDNLSVTRAEREADFWIFGGIFRPVFLEAKPIENIQRVAIDAKASGDFQADIYLSGLKNAVKLAAEILSPEGKTVAVFQSTPQVPVTRLSGKVDSPKTWNPESPNLYTVVFTLFDKKGQPIHQVTKRIGFRTVEVREADGIYVNGVRIKMKGVCRHTFHPKYGRTSSKALSLEDLNLMKEMNMNAVRMSHYPPEEHFLDACDSLGMFVLDELTAWQRPSYDDVVGRKLLEEMIARDVNHPSVILWDNGNEGGENNNLNDDFAELDIQKRKVLHPWQDYDLTNTLHYIDYNYLSLDGFSKRKIFFPTEFLHGLYDGGHGAGLDDYWDKMWNDPLCAGGFLWVFADESVERTDRNRELDSDGNHAPDGILGPYHEKEGSFYTIKEIWAPVYFEKRYITPEFDGTFRIENRYLYTNLNQCAIRAEWVRFAGPNEPAGEKITSVENLKLDLGAGQKGILQVQLPSDWRQQDALRLKITDATGRLLNTWSWPVKFAETKASELIVGAPGNTPVVNEFENRLTITAGKIAVTFNLSDGTVAQLTTDGRLVPLSGGPLFVGQDKAIKQVVHRIENNHVIVEVQYENSDQVKWTIKPDGLLDLNVSYEPAHNCLFAGITFNYPEDKIAGMKWLGNGPYRVYKNRMKGTAFGLWGKAYNNSVTGESGFIYPEFKGYHANTYWVKVLGNDVPDFTIFVHSNDIFLRMLTPREPKAPAQAKMEYPQGDLSFLQGINAIGNKFMDATSLGPQSSTYFYYPSRFHGAKQTIWLTFDFR